MIKGYGLPSPYPKPTPIATRTPPPAIPASAKSTGRHDSPVDGDDDGKTPDCNRAHTFETFVPPHKLGGDKDPKRIGATWDVVRAIVKLKRPLRRLRRQRAERERARKVEGGREGLMRLDSNEDVETVDTAELVQK